MKNDQFGETIKFSCVANLESGTVQKTCEILHLKLDEGAGDNFDENLLPCK